MKRIPVNYQTWSAEDIEYLKMWIIENPTVIVSHKANDYLIKLFPQRTAEAIHKKWKIIKKRIESKNEVEHDPINNKKFIRWTEEEKKRLIEWLCKIEKVKMNSYKDKSLRELLPNRTPASIYMMAREINMKKNKESVGGLRENVTKTEPQFDRFNTFKIDFNELLNRAINGQMNQVYKECERLRAEVKQLQEKIERDGPLLVQYREWREKMDELDIFRRI